MIIDGIKFRWPNVKQRNTTQGTFFVSWSPNQLWEFGDAVVLDKERLIVYWAVDGPVKGTLIKYLKCGTKRFIKSETK